MTCQANTIDFRTARNVIVSGAIQHGSNAPDDQKKNAGEMPESHKDGRPQLRLRFRCAHILKQYSRRTCGSVQSADPNFKRTQTEVPPIVPGRD